MKKDWQHSTYPYARVKDDPRFIEHAKNNQWADRRANGYPWKMDVFQFIANTYGEFLDTGKMVQADYLGIDDKLWWRIQNSLRTEAMPNWLNLSKEADSIYLKIDSPIEKAKIDGKREYLRERQRKYVANLKNRQP